MRENILDSWAGLEKGGTKRGQATHVPLCSTSGTLLFVPPVSFIILLITLLLPY